MRTTLAGRCVRRTASRTTDITAWARKVVAAPARYGATPHEAGIVASLLTELELAR